MLFAAPDTMVIYALSRRRRDAAFTAAASGPAAPDAPPCHVDPTAPFLGRAAHGSVAAAVAAVRGASGAEAAVLRVAAFRQRPSLSPTLLLPAAVEEAPVAGGAAMAGPPDAAVTAVYAVPNRAELDMAEGGGGLTEDKVRNAVNTITLEMQMLGKPGPLFVDVDPTAKLEALLFDFCVIEGSSDPARLKLMYCGMGLALDKTAQEYNIHDGNKVFVVLKPPGTS